MTTRSPTARPLIWNVNRGHRLSRGLAFYSVFQAAGSAKNAVDNRSASTAALAFSSGPFGRAINATTESSAPSWPSNYRPIKGSNGDGTGDFTLLWVGNPGTAAATSMFNQRCNSSPDFTQVALLSNFTVPQAVQTGALCLFLSDATGGGAGLDYGATTDTTAVDGNWHVYVAGNRGGTFFIYVDGVLNVASQVAPGALKFISTNPQILRIGGPGGTTGTLINCSVAVAGGWNRALSVEEVQALSADVWAPLRGFNGFPLLADFAGAAPPVAATTYAASFYDLPPKLAQRLAEYQAAFWNPRTFVDAAPPAFAIPVLSELPPRAAQRLVEYPAFFWGPRVIPAPAVTYASSFYDLPPKVAQRLAVYEAAWWNPARFVDAAPPKFAIPVLTDLPSVLQIPRRLVDYQAAFWNPLGGYTNPAPPAFAIPPGLDAATPRAPARLVEYAAAFWDPRLVVNAAPPAFSIPSFTDVPKVASRPAFYEQPAWAPQPFDIRYASVFDQLPPKAQQRLVEYQATFLALPVPPPPTSTPSALWQPQYPDLLLPAARLPDYSFFVLPYADYGGSINPPVQTGGIPQPIYGFWINARKRARHIAKQTNVKAAINQEINRALADLKENDAAATERAFARILAAEAVLQQQKYLKGLLEAHALETRLLAARRAAELAQEEQDINDLIGKL